MKKNINLKDYVIKSEVNPVGEQAEYEAGILIIGLVIALLFGFMFGIKSFYHWIVFIYFINLVVVIINWIFERDKYLEKKK